MELLNGGVSEDLQSLSQDEVMTCQDKEHREQLVKAFVYFQNFMFERRELKQ